MRTQRIEEVIKTAVWQLWHEGEPIEQIARKVNRKRPSVFVYLERHGGIEPRQRTRVERMLGTEDREEISRGLHAGQSLRQILSESALQKQRIERYPVTGKVI